MIKNFKPWLAKDHKGRYASLGKNINLSKTDLFNIFSGKYHTLDEKISIAEYEVENGKTLCDVYQTSTKILIVSDRVKEFLEKNNIPDLIFIRAKLGNHSNYQILYSCALLSVLELQKSQLSWSLTHPELLRYVGPHFNNSQIPEESEMFRIKEYPYLLLISNNLQDKLEKERFTGLKWGSFISSDNCFFVDEF